MLRFEKLNPTYQMIGIKDNVELYKKLYIENILSKLDPDEVRYELEALARCHNKDAVCLMCYESPEKFCHRHIVADWIGAKELIL